MKERERERVSLLPSRSLHGRLSFAFPRLSFLTFDSEDLIILASLLLTLAPVSR